MSGISVNYDVDEMWGGVKEALSKEGVPCSWNDCHECLQLRAAIILIDKYIDELSGRGFE